MLNGPIDSVLLHGRVITPEGPSQALAISGDRIAAVGSDEQIQALTTERIEQFDLQGRTVLPGFIDSHTHLVSTGLIETIYLSLTGARSLAEALESVRETCRAGERALGAGEWLLGWGWEESRWPERRYLTRRDLDQVAPDRPVALFRVDGHLLVLNSKALELIDLPEEFAGRADLDRGLLWEEAAWWFHEQLEPSPEELERALEAAIKKAHSLGITSVHDIVRPSYIRAYQRLRAAGRLNLRIYLNPRARAGDVEQLFATGLRTGFGDEWLRLGGVKIFADGSIGAGNAALSESYLDREGRGRLNYSDEELCRIVQEAHKQGWQVLIHAIGDRAIKQVLKIYELVGVSPSDRYRIEHLELASVEQLEQAARMGLVASMQPNFLNWAKPGDLYEIRLGRNRTEQINPFRLALDAGLRLALGSDCMPLGPLFGIHQAVNAPHPSQHLTVEEAIHGYTLGGAYASFEEGLKGSIEPGKLADLVVLSEDPFEHPEAIEEIEVELTFVGGELVFRRSGSERR